MHEDDIPFGDGLTPEERGPTESHDHPLDPQSDCFRPPVISTIVHCIHCGEEYDSYRIEWRIDTDHEGKPHGFWCCPIEGCDGKGFGFDIFPIDPEWTDENGERTMTWFDDDEDDDEEEFDDDEFSPDEDAYKPRGQQSWSEGESSDEDIPF